MQERNIEDLELKERQTISLDLQRDLTGLEEIESSLEDTDKIF